jgi:tetratricopeptide (TPR) repeat protein
MGWAYNFMGETQKAEEHFKLAGPFSPRRNEHFVYLAFHYENLGNYEKVLETIDLMCNPEKTNPFPDLAFLIEDRCYLNTSNFLNEYRESITKKMSEPVIDSESFTFDFK